MYITSTNILVSELAHSCSESFNYYCLYIWLCNCFYFQDSLNSYCLPHTHTHTHARTHACTHACTHTHTRYVVGTVFGFEPSFMCARKLIHWSSPRKYYYSLVLNILGWSQLRNYFNSEIFLTYVMFILCLNDLFTVNKRHNCSWTSWVGGYYIVLPKLRIIRPPPLSTST